MDREAEARDRASGISGERVKDAGAIVMAVVIAVACLGVMFFFGMACGMGALCENYGATRVGYVNGQYVCVTETTTVLPLGVSKE